MKIRIQDNSVRMRMTLREVDALATDGIVSRSTQVVTPNGLGPRFEYRLVCDAGAAESRVEMENQSITVRLCHADHAELLRPDQEGVYIRREWVSPEGEAHRFMVFVEKDRPGSTCVKKEQWIYNAPPHGPVETRPIPPKSQTPG